MTAPTFSQSGMWFTKDTAADPLYVGEQTYNAGNYRSMDVLGVFNPRDYWSNVIDGPSDNWGTNAYFSMTFVSGTIFTSTATWWRDAAKTIPMMLQAFTYSGTNYVAPTSCKWSLYNTAGTTVIHTCTDTYTYTSGVFLSGVGRAFT